MMMTWENSAKYKAKENLNKEAPDPRNPKKSFMPLDMWHVISLNDFKSKYDDKLTIISLLSYQFRQQ